MTEESEGPECPPYLRKRTKIEEEIRNRQARWRGKRPVKAIERSRERAEKQELERPPSAEETGVGDTEPDREAPPPPRSRSGR